MTRESRSRSAGAATSLAGDTRWIELTAKLQAAGLTRPSFLPYAVHLTLWSAVLCVCLWYLGDAPDEWKWSLTAVFAGGYAMLRLGLVAHDLSHGAGGVSRRWVRFWGLLLWNLGLGISHDWWTFKHGRHHCRPNVIGEDPDCEHAPLAVSPEQVVGWSRTKRWFASRQLWLLPVAIALPLVDLTTRSVRHLVVRRDRLAACELALIAGHQIWGFAVLTRGQPWYLALGWFVALRVVAGAAGFIGFETNHVGRRYFRPGDTTPPFDLQVQASRNIHGFLARRLWWTLAYQIEHHLWPSMPVNRLPDAARHTRRFCEDRQIPYCSQGGWRAIREYCSHMRAVALRLRTSHAGGTPSSSEEPSPRRLESR